MKQPTRCEWANPNNPLYLDYHDTEWGVPVYDDQHLFEMICLEGAQAGLSWETVLKKRQNYKKHFKNFDPINVSKFTDKKLDTILLDPGIIRNRLKIYSVRKNAQAFLEIKKEFGLFSTYIWNFVNAKPIQNKHTQLSETPSNTPISDAMSKDLKKRGFNFVGSTICYAFMQACGLVNDHTTSCFRYKECKKLRPTT